MKKELFEELFESVKQGGAIIKGAMKPSRTIEHRFSRCAYHKGESESGTILQRIKRVILVSCDHSAVYRPHKILYSLTVK